MESKQTAVPGDMLPAYLNSTLSLEIRIADLLARMTLEEKLTQLQPMPPAIERLKIPAGTASQKELTPTHRTTFPQPIGLAATWNPSLIQQVAQTISDEIRADYQEMFAQNDPPPDLILASPDLNLLRDPRWGRGQQTFGEDPYLTSRLGVNFIQGLQQGESPWLKTAAAPKAFEFCKGAKTVPPRDLYEAYFPPLRAAIREGKTAAMTVTVNALNGDGWGSGPSWIESIIRQCWHFTGSVILPPEIQEMLEQNYPSLTPAEISARLLKAGCDQNNAPTAGEALKTAHQRGLIAETDLDRALTRLFTLRFRLGLFEPPDQQPYMPLPAAIIDSPAHRELARRTAAESIVLLKNERRLLPLRKELKTLAVIGPHAHTPTLLLGEATLTPPRTVTPLEGIRIRVNSNTQVLYTPGCHPTDPDRSGFAEAIELARRADLTLVFLGLTPELENAHKNRSTLALPDVQEALLQALQVTGSRIVLVLINGTPLAIPWAQEHIPAILEAWYPGAEGGMAVADVIFGEINPAGRLPVTFYREDAQLPPFENYAMAGRTYRYFNGSPLYPFGHGLSYSSFQYRALQISPTRIKAGEKVEVSVEIQNTGDRAGDEVVQLYVTDVAAAGPVPYRQLQGFRRLHLLPGARQTVQFTLMPCQLALYDAEGKRWVEPGVFEISVGGQQPSWEDLFNNQSNVLTGRLDVGGEPILLPE